MPPEGVVEEEGQEAILDQVDLLRHAHPGRETGLGDAGTEHHLLKPEEERGEHQPGVTEQPVAADAGDGVEEDGRRQSQEGERQVADRRGLETVE